MYVLYVPTRVSDTARQVAMYVYTIRKNIHESEAIHQIYCMYIPSDVVLVPNTCQSTEYL